MAYKAKWDGSPWQRHAVTAGVAGIAAVFGLAGALVVLGHEQKPAQAPIITNYGPELDPASVNLANPGVSPAFYSQQAAGQSQRVRVLPASAAYTPQSSGTSYPAGQQAPAPIVRGNSSTQNESLQYNTQPPLPGDSQNSQNAQSLQNSQTSQDPQNPQDTAAQAYNGEDDPNYVDAQESAGYEAIEQADQPPPALPEYDQPPAPDDNYLWTPGYWGYNTGYYWVPGAWVAPPFYGALWTPPWWGLSRGRYCFHRGYWGSHIGYYGGINYGHGYVGSGFYGGYWQGRNFFYNRAVTNVNVSRVRNVYDRAVVINNVTYGGRSQNRASFNGPGGIRMQPRPYELAAMREAHYAPVPAQVQVRQSAASNRGQFFSQNHGQPAEAFRQRPLASNAGIANLPQQPPINQPRYGQGTQGSFGSFQRNQPNINRTQRDAEVSRPIPPGAGEGSPRNDMIKQRSGLWTGGNRERTPQLEQQRNTQIPQGGTRQVLQQGNPQIQQGNPQIQQQRELADQQRSLQLQQQQQRSVQQQQRELADQQRNMQFQQQHNLQVLQQQQHDAAQQQQRDVQSQQQQWRNQQVQQQRDASEQVRHQPYEQQEQQQRTAMEQQRNQQFQQQQQQRMVMEQQRNQQFQQQQQQQQRMAMEQQRNQQFQQQQQQQRQMAPQHIDARPSPQRMEQPRGGQPFGGAHGRPQ